uniref:uncharacterized protein LOC122605754 n=1 Tax=Erigeron canadensis TaxID=72917 RepID=UPI001CB9BE81|nr:uncharacterized protein LOC122605754 [Erigeron canadensis]
MFVLHQNSRNSYIFENFFRKMYGFRFNMRICQRIYAKISRSEMIEPKSFQIRKLWSEIVHLGTFGQVVDLFQVLRLIRDKDCYARLGLRRLVLLHLLSDFKAKCL